MKLNITEVEFLLGQMNSAQKEHPKATVYYDAEAHEVRITYPLPRDLLEIKSLKITNPL